MIVPLTTTHARDAARLHVAGQPGTFLTELGVDVLTVFYAALPQSAHGMGFAVVQPNADGRELVQGFISATSSVGALFVELGTRRIGRFLPPLLRRFRHNPQLAIRAAQTVFYPLLVREPGAAEKTAELLSIMVEPAYRSRGLGAQLLAALLAECDRRALPLLDVTVDAKNAGARRFYTRHGFGLRREFQLVGRPMCLYQRGVGTSSHG